MIYTYVHIPTGTFQRVSIPLEDIIEYAKINDWPIVMVVEEWELIKIEDYGENIV